MFAMFLLFTGITPNRTRLLRRFAPRNDGYDLRSLAMTDMTYIVIARERSDRGNLLRLPKSPNRTRLLRRAALLPRNDGYAPSYARLPRFPYGKLAMTVRRCRSLAGDSPCSRSNNKKQHITFQLIIAL
jgi:hypothetical protein